MTYEPPNILRCDECSDGVFEADGARDLTRTLMEAKTKGWRSFKGPDDEWAHACPSCVADFAKRRI